MNIHTKLPQIIILFCLIVLLTACGGLPDMDVQQAEQLTEKFTINLKKIEDKSNQNSQFLKTEKGSFLQSYAKQENWNKFFTQAKLTLELAQQNYKKIIIPILDRNEEKEVLSLRVETIKINRLLLKSQNEAKQASQRANFLVDAKTNAPQQFAQAQKNIIKIDGLMADAANIIIKPAADYPAKKTDIKERYGKLDKQREKAHSSLSMAAGELDKVAEKKANYAIYADNIKSVSDTLKQLTGAVPALDKTLKQLYRSYSKTLVDMGINYHVQLGRTSWDNYYDYPTEHTKFFNSKVAKDVATYFDKLADGKVAWVNQRGSLRIYIDKRMWSALKIVPNSGWSSGDDEGEFWVNNIILKYYHKYIINENQSQKSTEWQAVKENYFLQNEKNLGMTIISKPYGMYEDETIKKAAPPGMEHIATPVMLNGKATGSNKYGEWRQDSSGTSFWHYFAAYAFMRSMTGGSPYYYNDWNNYNNRNHNTGYYGTNNNYGTYGSSTYNNSRYKNSTYSKQNQGVKTASGRQKLQTASIRNSGPKSRGRGPSGGGK
ncbi:MAG: hypothetical protein QM479_03790 [Pseudomonadota bacterium]